MNQKQARRASWMSAVSKHVTEKKPSLVGMLDWNTLSYLYSTGISPQEAAEKYLTSQ